MGGAREPNTDLQALEGDWWRDPAVFLTIFEHSPDMIVVLNDDFTVRYRNPTTQRIFGYSDELLNTVSVIELVHPDDVTTVAAELGSGKESGSARFRLRTAAGAWRWVEGTGVDLRDRPDVNGIVIVARDVTDAHEAAEAVSESESRYRGVIETLAEGVMLIDADGRIVAANPAAEKIFGTPDRELVGGDVRSPDWAPVDAAGERLPVERLPAVVTLRTGQPQRGVILGAAHPSGRRIWISVNTSMIPGSPDASLDGHRGHPVLVCSFTDLTELIAIQQMAVANEQQFRTLVAESFDVVVSMDADGMARYVSPAITKLLGYEPARLIGTSLLDLVHPDDLPLAVERLAEVIARPESPRAVRLRIRHANGSFRWMEIIGTNRLDEDPVSGIILNSRDITDRIAVEHELAAEKERYERLIDALPDLVIRYDHNLDVVYANPAARLLIGTGRDGGRSRPHTVEITDPDVQLAVNELRAAINTKRNRKYEQLLTIDGEERWYEVTLLPELDAGGEVKHLMSLGRDVTPYKQKEQRLLQQSLEDTLTGLANRTAFEQHLEHALEAVHRRGGTTAVLFLDLDRFKYVNDSLGHSAGDDLLVAVADRFRAAVRPGDLVARFGGDEFAILPDRLGTVGDAELLAERIHQLLIEPVKVADDDIRVSASIGIASTDGTRPTSAESLIQDADLAMYRAKREGRARTAVHRD